jgi:hypothetical protein
VDIVNDIYFEFGLNGILSPDNQGNPIHFRNPMQHALGGGAYGNSLTFAATASGEFFDLPAGSLIDGRPTSVIRVAAPTDGSAFGADTGVRYSILDLLSADRVEAAFPTGVAYWGNSCGEGQSSEIVLVDAIDFADVVAELDPSLLMVSADEPTVSNVADFQCQLGLNNSVELSWRGTGRYAQLEIARRSLTDDSRAEWKEGIFTYSTADGDDPEEHLDVTIRVPADGTYEYRVRATGEDGDEAAEVFSVVTIGRGAPESSHPVPPGADNSPRNPRGPRPAPFAVTHTGQSVYAVDFNTGVAQQFVRGTLEHVGEVRGPFANDGKTTGVAFNSGDGKLYWIGRLLEGSHAIQSTDRNGGTRGPRLPVQFPIPFLRSPVLGDLSYDAERDQFWVADIFNNILFAIAPDGSYRENTVIENPLLDGLLSGGVAVAAADADGVTLDIAVGPADGIVDRLLRNRYELTSLDSPLEEYRLDLARVTGSAAVGGVDVMTVGEEEMQLVAGYDTARLYRLSLEPAEVVGNPFRRGDINNDGAQNISDPSFLLSFLFKGGPAPTCDNAADVDDSGVIDLTDAIALFNYLFRGMAQPAPPFLACGFDATPSDLECESSFCSEQEP